MAQEHHVAPLAHGIAARDFLAFEDRCDKLFGNEIGEVDAVFDEGILSWGQYALERGFRFLPLEGAVRASVTAAGYDVINVTPSRLPALRQPVPAIDFCGWPMVVHADMPDDLAYALCEVLEARKLAIPTDNYKPLDLAQLASPDEETPRGAPLHPGAERFYREMGITKDTSASQ